MGLASYGSDQAYCATRNQGVLALETVYRKAPGSGCAPLGSRRRVQQGYSCQKDARGPAGRVAAEMKRLSKP